MSEKYFMRQCTLERQIDNKTWKTVTWIPEKFCEVGKILKLKDENDHWINGWKVVSVGSFRMKNEDVERNSRRYLTQRRASDI